MLLDDKVWRLAYVLLVLSKLVDRVRGLLRWRP